MEKSRFIRFKLFYRTGIFKYYVIFVLGALFGNRIFAGKQGYKLIR